MQTCETGNARLNGIGKRERAKRAPRSKPVHIPFTSRSFPVFLERDPVERTVYGKVFLTRTVHCNHMNLCDDDAINNMMMTMTMMVMMMMMMMMVHDDNNVCVCVCVQHHHARAVGGILWSQHRESWSRDEDLHQIERGH